MDRNDKPTASRDAEVRVIRRHPRIIRVEGWQPTATEGVSVLQGEPPHQGTSGRRDGDRKSAEHRK